MEGKTIRSKSVKNNGATVTLKLVGGRTVDCPVDQLSEEARAALGEE